MAAETTTGGAGAPHISKDPAGRTWQQTMLRIKDPAVSVPFYEKHFGFTNLCTMHFPQWKFSVYFIGIPAPGKEWPAPETQEARDAFYKYEGVLIELTHNHGTESDDSFSVNNGNVEPHRGFGHIAVMTDDVYASCELLEANGCRFHKRPDEGRMKGLAFALDPDGYWIEIISRSPDHKLGRYTLAQTMLRVKDPKASVAFYETHFGMTLLCERHFPPERGDFSLYFLATLPAGTELPDPSSPEAMAWMKSWDGCVLELTHNHGTESDPEFSYHNGNDEPQGFGHIGFLVPSVYEQSDAMLAAGVPFKKKPDDGMMKNLAFALDPDGYSVEILQWGMKYTPPEAEESKTES